LPKKQADRMPRTDPEGGCGDDNSDIDSSLWNQEFVQAELANHDGSGGLSAEMTGSNRSAPVPTRPEDITAAWLTAFLEPHHPGVVVDAIEIVGSTQGAATRLRVTPHYAPGCDAGLPPGLFIKTALTRRMLVADPHMYVTEFRFYDEIRPTLDCETPAVYGWALDEATSRFAVVIEELSLRSATFPSALSGLTGADVAPLVTTLARLHATNWGHADLEQRFGWLETSTRGKTASWWRDEAKAVAEVELEQPYKAAAFSSSGRSLDQLFAAFAALQEANDASPRTVLHGDTHIGNCYLLPDGSGGLLDWQLMRVANWANDVAYLVMTALDVDQRRDAEKDLLRLYCDELRSRGVDPPDWNDAWDLYRKQMVWGIAAWLVTPTAMYDEERLDALIRRCLAAAEDLDTFVSLGV
jgi:aminoglycoside phosphotransferase (APT) family kinase protein